MKRMSLKQITNAGKIGARMVWRVVPITLALFILYVGLMNLPGGATQRSTQHGHDHSGSAAASKGETWYTCSMHPTVRSKSMGKCPICGMDLIEASPQGEGAGWQLHMNESARALAAVETRRVELRSVTDSVELLGRVRYDEQRLVSVTSWVAGRIERLYVNYTGKSVKAWEPLISIYSPELYAAQLELVSLLKQTRAGEPSLAGELTRGAVRATTSKLRLLGLTHGQIERIRRTRKPLERITVYAPAAGTVTALHVTRGAYVSAGTPLISLARTRRLWVVFELAERDLHLVAEGQGITYRSDALPGKVFVGRIEFLDPGVRKSTGAAVVRASVDNSAGFLREGMYLRGTTIADRSSKKLPAVPRAAVLYTGRSSVVYVKKMGKEGEYEGRLVTLGPLVKGWYLIPKGVSVGEEVVTEGNFMLDSSLQITARPSMMNPLTQERNDSDKHAQFHVPRVVVPEAFKKELGELVTTYYGIHEGLKKDDLKRAKEAAAKFARRLALIKRSGPIWDSYRVFLHKGAEGMTQAKDIAVARSRFFALARYLALSVKSFGVEIRGDLFLHYCPMARDNKGGWWLSSKPEIENPFFGASMYSCGENLEALARSAKAGKEKSVSKAKHQHKGTSGGMK